MDLSFRSGPRIMDVTNDVFDNIAQNPVLMEKDQPAADAWQSRFTTHKTAKKEYESYVEMVEAPWQEIDEDSLNEKSDEEYDNSDEEAAEDKTCGAAQLREMVYQYAADKIVELYNETRDARLSIGVLTRGKAAAGRMAQIIKERGLECSEEGKSALLDAAEVQQILALLHWIDHPGDSAAQYQVCQCQLSELVNPKGGPLFTGAQQKPVAFNAFLPQLQRLRIQLMTSGYGPVVERCAELLADQATTRNRRRLEILVEKAYEYDARKTCRTDDFNAVIETLDVSDITSSRIRIMNYHLSKGLQFDIVVLPELDVDFNKISKAKIVPGQKEADQPPFAVLRYISDKLLGYVDESIRTIFEQYRKKLTEESLCLLYVALTRAIHALYLFIQPPKPKKEGKNPVKSKLPNLKLPKTFAGILRGSLCPDVELTEKPEEPVVLYQIGDENWFRKIPAAKNPIQESGAGSGAGVGVGAGVGAGTGVGAESETDAVTDNQPKRLNESLRCAPGKAGLRVYEPISATGWETKTPPGAFLKIRRFSCVQTGNSSPRVFDKPGRDAAQPLSPTNRGRLIHRWLEDIEYSDEYRFNPGRLIALGVALGLQPEEVEPYLEPFHQLLANEALQKRLRRPDTAWSVYREKIVAGILAAGPETNTAINTVTTPVAPATPAVNTVTAPATPAIPAANTPEGANTSRKSGIKLYLANGTIDRLTLHRNESGTVDQAVIIDYKTVPAGPVQTDFNGSEVALSQLNYRTVKRFANQMDAYRQLISKTYQLPLTAIETEILLIEY